MPDQAKTRVQFSHLPEGTVTFLFTDIEGSTQLLSQLRDRYADLLADQRRILRSAFARWGGQEVDTQGDAFFVAFPRATQAVCAAVEIQRALTIHQWPEGVEVRVRMGLHTGEPLKAEEGYVGMDVHRAARIAHVGHGGQVLLSETTAPLIMGELPEGVELVDLGRHLLKDMQRPEHIRQLVIEGLSFEFPPLKSLEMELTVPQHNLPAPVSSFIGRGKELGEIASLLEDPDTRLLTLVGPPGVGKTRLALETAMRQVANFTAGAWLVELAPVEKTAGILPAMASALGVEIAQSSGVDLESALEASLNRGPLLLIVDNCEHLLEGVAPLIGKLLRHCPELSILATSREWLRVTGEVTYPVPAFDISRDGVGDLEKLEGNEAMHFFVERARAVQPDFALTEDNILYVSHICRQLDGIALAIELAAARMRVLSERELADNLGRRFALLTYGGRDVLPKMRTLHASLEWSYELLHPLEQEVLDRLSVFRGGCALPEATYVCGGEGVESWEVLETLSSLIQKSLVLRVESSFGRTRYNTLESIAELGREHLQENDIWLDTRQRHAEVYYNLAKEAGDFVGIKDDAPWMERLVEDEANLAATLHSWDEVNDAERVIHFSWYLRNYYMHRYHLGLEMENIVQRAVASGRLISPSTRGLGLAVLGLIAQFKPDYPASESYYCEAREIGIQESDTYLLMQGLYGEAMIGFLSGDRESALLKSDQALKLAVELGDEEIPWTLEWYIIGTKPFQDRQEAYLKCFEVATKIANTNMLAVASQSLGWDQLSLGEFKMAEQYTWMAFRAWKRLKNRLFRCSNLWTIAWIYMCQGLYDQAIDLLEQSIQLGRTIGIARVQIRGMGTKAGLDFDRGDLIKAQKNLWELRPLVKGYPSAQIDCLFISGRIEHAQGELDNALKYLLEASELVNSYQGSYGWPAVYFVLAIVLHELGEDNSAMENFLKTVEILSEEYEHPEMVELLEWLALFSADLERWNVAARFLAANESLRQISGIVPPVPYRELWAETRQRVKMNLTESEYHEAWDEASAIEQLSIPDYALKQLARLELDEVFEIQPDLGQNENP